MANYRGIPNIKFVWHGDWADPELIYKGHSFNYWDLEDALWGDYVEQECEGNADKGNDNEFNSWIKKNIDYVYGYLNDWIAANEEINTTNKGA